MKDKNRGKELVEADKEIARMNKIISGLENEISNIRLKRYLVNELTKDVNKKHGEIKYLTKENERLNKTIAGQKEFECSFCGERLPYLPVNLVKVEPCKKCIIKETYHQVKKLNEQQMEYVCKSCICIACGAEIKRVCAHDGCPLTEIEHLTEENERLNKIIDDRDFSIKLLKTENETLSICIDSDEATLDEAVIAEHKQLLLELDCKDAHIAELEKRDNAKLMNEIVDMFAELFYDPENEHKSMEFETRLKILLEGK